MAIPFARVENLQRSKGENACRTSAYISHDRVVFEGTKFQEKAIYNFSNRSEVCFGGVFLPEGVNEKFRDPSVLWNAAEQAENRKNSQTAIHEVIALPDDIEVTDLDRQNLVIEYANKNYVRHGLGVQVAIHKELSEDGTYHNTHAHFLGTTRRFNKDGNSLGEKARDLMPTIKKGLVIEKSERGDKWGDDQNLYFEEHGIPVRVDRNSIVPQIHLGPVRMRSKNSVGIILENELRKEANTFELKEPKAILSKILETRSFFTQEDVFEFASKNGIKAVLDDFWKQGEIVELLDPETSKPTGKYTSQHVIEEEKQILRLSERVYNQKQFKIEPEISLQKYTKNLSGEQTAAFENIIKEGKGLSIVEGHAGTGKSYLLSEFNNFFKDNGYVVRSFGPDSVTVGVLKEHGMDSPKTIHKFMFDHKHGKVIINRNKEVWLVDESGKIGNRSMSEFLKVAEINKARVVFCGSSSQLSSIERGGMFRVFSQEYGSQVLNNIQRQKTKTQLKITNNLAQGRMNQAIGEIVHYGGAKFKWSKEAANRALISQWIADRADFPGASTVIIANSYKEINKFNGCVREQLKKEGTISAEEKLCKTFYGNVFISVGDKIEFRQNNPEIGVVNGLHGLVTKLCENEINVQYQDEKKVQKTIKFDPRDFVHYSLPYAKTYSRVQGKTYDRAYVSNTSYMNLQRFYVAGTRHRYKMYVFSANYEAKNVAGLKLQVSKSGWKGSTLSYTTQKQIQNEKEIRDHSNYINDLKNSPYFISRLRGKTHEAFDVVGSYLKKFHQAALDRPRNEGFYKYEETDYKGQGAVVDITSDELQQYDKNQTKLNWKDLSTESKTLLKSYFDCVDKADALGIVVKEEKASSSPLLHEGEWKKACGIRNKAAYDVMTAIPKESMKKAISQKGIDILNDRSLRHEAYLSMVKENKIDVESGLRQNLEPLLYKLFPDGPTQRTAKGLRFGSNGSLSVTLVGKHSGSYKDFEKGDGGGMVQLISKTLGCDRAGALKWAKEFLGASQSIEVPKHFKNHFKDKEDNWISMKAEANHVSPDLKRIAPFFLKAYTENARYAYKNENGEVLFYTVRLVSKDNPSKKIVLPLSYGRYQGDENPRWQLKGYQEGGKIPLYNLKALHENSQATVLVVEGEKTAEAAQKICERDNMCCVTWSGGASAASKSDWSALSGRNVIIWPDNDKAGFKAADDVCVELRKVGVTSIGVVDKKTLSESFPQKWDLADPLPEGKSQQHIRDLMLNGQGQAVSLDSVVALLGIHEKLEQRFVDKLMINEILWRTDERLRPSLEEKFGSKDWEIKNAIKNETVAILSGRGRVKEELEQKHNVPTEMAKRMEFCALVHQAKTGLLPDDNEIKQLRELVANCNSPARIPEGLANVPKEVADFAVNKTLADQYTSLTSKKISDQHFQQVVTQTALNITKQIEYSRLQEPAIKQKNLQLDLGRP